MIIRYVIHIKLQHMAENNKILSKFTETEQVFYIYVCIYKNRLSI